jgi:hypothetical protein
MRKNDRKSLPLSGIYSVSLAAKLLEKNNTIKALITKE